MPAEVIANTIVIPFNDPEGAVEVLRRHVDELACVLIDPVPWRIGLVPTSTEYLAALRAFCDETGVLLVSDEVGSFRIGYGGAMGALGAVADLTVMGKVIGGGMPIGAVAGKAEVMSVFDPSRGKPKLPHSGSYNANPVSMTAGVASLRLLTEDQMRRIGVLGEQVRDAMRKTIEANDLDWQVNGMASLFRVLTGTVPGSSATPAKLGHLLFQALLENGILIGDSGLGCVSTPMIEADIDEFGAAFDTAVTATIDRARAEG
jgi:glutamate-1-semialdehyde 2,1-aminomutase